MLRLVVVPCLNAHKRHVRDPLYSFNSLLEDLFTVCRTSTILKATDQGATRPHRRAVLEQRASA